MRRRRFERPWIATARSSAAGLLAVAAAVGLPAVPATPAAGPLAAAAATTAPTPAAAGSDAALHQADEARARFDYERAIPLYEKAVLDGTPGAKDYEARLKLANAYFWHAVELESDEQERYLDRCLVVLQALALERPRSAEVQAEIGRTLGQLALHRGGKEKIKLGMRIRDAAERALRLDSGNALANAVLGKWHYELASLSGFERTVGTVLFGRIPEGSFEASAEYLRKAVRLDPKMPYFRLMLARSLLKLDARTESREQLEALIGLHPLEGPDRGYIAEARELLKELGGK